MNLFMLLLVIKMGGYSYGGVTSQTFGPYHTLNECQSAAKWVGNDMTFLSVDARCIPVNSEKGGTK